MRLDRRSFVRGSAGVLAWLAGAPARLRAAESKVETALAIHRETRNTPVGALGERLWRLTFEPRRYKPYAGIARLALPPDPSRTGRPLAQVVREWTPAPAIAGFPLSLAELGHLLRFTNGVTGRAGGILLRAAPSAGALYSGEVYVVAVAVEDLPPGVYNFHVRRHTLVPVRRGDFAARVAEALERPGPVARAPAFVLLTNVFQRYTHRYRNRGYRYALIDTGHVAENLRLVAASAGLASLPFLRFHDAAANDLLSIDGREEAVCALYAGGRSAGAAAPGEPRELEEKQRALPSFEASGSAPERYHEATKLVPSARARRVTQPEPRAATAAGTTPGQTPRTSVERAIQVRRSASVFRPEPMLRDDLATVMELAGGHPALELAPGVEIFVVVHRVTGLPPGIYRWERARGLVLVRKGDQSGALRRVCLWQSKASEAAVGVAMAAPVAEAASLRGERSYRDLLIESGAIGQRLYLAAEALGLAARNLAAYLDDDMNELLSLDGRRRAVVHLTMVGPGS